MGRSATARRSMYAIVKHTFAFGVSALLAVASVSAAQAEHRVADAAERRDTDAIRALLKARADVNGRQPDGATALQWAAHWDALDVADLLLRAGADVNVAND